MTLFPAAKLTEEMENWSLEQEDRNTEGEKGKAVQLVIQLEEESELNHSITAMVAFLQPTWKKWELVLFLNNNLQRFFLHFPDCKAGIRMNTSIHVLV